MEDEKGLATGGSSNKVPRAIADAGVPLSSCCLSLYCQGSSFAKLWFRLILLKEIALTLSRHSRAKGCLITEPPTLGKTAANGVHGSRPYADAS
jgi:hypothetical protein